MSLDQAVERAHEQEAVARAHLRTELKAATNTLASLAADIRELLSLGSDWHPDYTPIFNKWLHEIEKALK